jgi:photosystem II stability/assembly factor-like uncharacterized protein
VNNKQPISARYGDLLPEQEDPALLELVQDLDMLYASHTMPTRLARPVEHTLNVQAAQPSVPLPPQPGTLSSFVPRRRVRWSRLNTLAAVLFTVILVGMLLGTFYLVHSTRPANPNTAPVSPACEAATPPAFTPPLLVGSIQMMSATEGWGLTQPGGKNQQEELLHTSDGGCHWKIASPSFYSLTGVIQYISGTIVWAIVTDSASGDTFFARTADGGQMWSFYPSAPAPGGANPPGKIEGASVTFLTPEIGWLMVNQYNKAIARYGLALYHTTDGGITWREVTNRVPVPALWAANIELGGADVPVSMRFLNSSTGWITGETRENGGSMLDTWLYVTHDGGVTWRKQDLPLNFNVVDGVLGTITYPPQFFSARDGLLTVSFWEPLGLSVYVTHDGGATWRPTTFLHVYHNNKIQTDRAIPTPVPAFSSMNFGWLWEDSSYQPPNILVTTSDDGQTWEHMSPPILSIYTSAQVEFVSSSVGWLLGFTRSVTSPPALFKTLDGGKTWTRINYSYSPYIVG